MKPTPRGRLRAQAWFWFCRAVVISVLELLVPSCLSDIELQPAPTCDGLPPEALEAYPPPICHPKGDDESQGAAWTAHPACAFDEQHNQVPLDDPAVVESFGCDGEFWRKEPR